MSLCKVENEEVREKALKIIKKSKIPIGIGDVARGLNVSWSTARAILFKLMLEGTVSGTKTTRSWIFVAKEEKKNEKPTGSLQPKMHQGELSE